MNESKQLREMIIALLDDEHGVCSAGYRALQSFAILHADGATADIFDMVESVEGRYYLPEEHGLIA